MTNELAKGFAKKRSDERLAQAQIPVTARKRSWVARGD
jgi:hypothetical protein